MGDVILYHGRLMKPQAHKAGISLRAPKAPWNGVSVIHFCKPRSSSAFCSAHSRFLGQCALYIHRSTRAVDGYDAPASEDPALMTTM